MRAAEIKNSTYIEINLQKANSSDIAEVTLFNQIKLNQILQHFQKTNLKANKKEVKKKNSANKKLKSEVDRLKSIVESKYLDIN